MQLVNKEIIHPLASYKNKGRQNKINSIATRKRILLLQEKGKLNSRTK